MNHDRQPACHSCPRCGSTIEHARVIRHGQPVLWLDKNGLAWLLAPRRSRAHVLCPTAHLQLEAVDAYHVTAFVQHALQRHRQLQSLLFTSDATANSSTARPLEDSPPCTLLGPFLDICLDLFGADNVSRCRKWPLPLIATSSSTRVDQVIASLWCLFDLFCSALLPIYFRPRHGLARRTAARRLCSARLLSEVQVPLLASDASSSGTSLHIIELPSIMASLSIHDAVRVVSMLSVPLWCARLSSICKPSFYSFSLFNLHQDQTRGTENINNFERRAPADTCNHERSDRWPRPDGHNQGL